VNGLLADPGIVRNRAKIEATVNNARRYGELTEAFGSLAAYVWQFEAQSEGPPGGARLRRPAAAGPQPRVQGDEQGPAPTGLVVVGPPIHARDHGTFTHLEPGSARPSMKAGQDAGRSSTETRRADHMLRLGRRTGWLGWAMAGVLLLSAEGAALAAQGATTTTQAPGASVDKAKGRAVAAFGRGARRHHALGRRVLHGEVTVQTREGVKTLVLVVARGQVTALSKGAITVKSADGVQTSFGIDGDTRFGFRNQPAPSAELKVGEDALVAGEQSGGRATARRVVAGDLARRAAGTGGGAGKATP
jgi:Methyladenine glycosylase